MRAGIVKRLSANDVGDTGGHQAGILVPRNPTVLNFFPSLDASRHNPRIELSVSEEPSGERWNFMYIYYNGRAFGGTRNEYRLTGMTRFLRASNARAGDEIEFTKDEDLSYRVRLRRASPLQVAEDDVEYRPGVLVLSGGWKVINF